MSGVWVAWPRSFGTRQGGSDPALHQPPASLLHAQRDQRIDSRGTPCRDVCREDPHHGHHARRADQDADVRRAQPEKQTLRNARGDDRERDPEHDSGRRPLETLADGPPQHVAVRSTKRHPEPQLARALNDVIGDEAVQTQAGQADRQDGWAFSPQDAIGYQDASYGYDGYDVDVNEYQYYFREGFNRGYEDGYYSRNQYGRYSNGTGNILSAILQTILNLQLVN